MSTNKRRVIKTFCTTREAAEILGVSLRTVQMWANNGLLELWKTEGGHRRISRKSVERLVLRESPTDAGGTAPAADTSTQPPRVLVVEDEADLLRLYRANLARWPSKPLVSTAADGYEALLRIGLEAPDLLILDLNMPRIDGFRVLKTVRSMPELKHLPIIVVTGLGSAEILAGGEIPGDVVVLGKPIPFDRLREMAEAMLAETRQSKTPLNAAA